ncbi:hypothetical protein ASG49_14085 [Marmoricola sp. Leaf446]|nr:hypothetical protein ASG49_14085 [Marmoricola sp. Leaf446]
MLRTTGATGAPAPARDLALLLARVALGAVLVAHGWQKAGGGLGATADGFAQMEIPLPQAAAAFAIGVELVGGAMLVLGLLTPVVGLLVLVDMAGALWFAHRDAGLFVTEGGGELVLVIGVLGLALAAVGAGRLSLDHALTRARA